MSLKVGELYSTIELRDQQFMDGMKNAEQSGSRLTDILKIGLAGAAGAVGAAFVGMAKTGLDNMRDIDDAMRNFQVQTGASGEEAERFTDTIQDLHKVNTDSYEELGEAVTEVRQRHGDLGDDMEDVTQDFLDYAKVTGQDTPQAIENLHGVQQAWGKELDDSNAMMDTFMAISQETGAEVSNLERAMSEAAPVMNALGMDFDEGAALLGHFESRGVDATTATRGLRNAMSRIEDPTSSQAEALMDLGVQVDELDDGVYKVADDALPQLMKRMSEGELSSQEMDAAMDILGRRAGVDMVRALQDGEAGIEEMMAVIEDSEGTVSDASEQYDKQLGERWQLIRRQYLEPFMEQIGTVLIGVLESALDFMETWGPHVADIFEDIYTFVSGVFTSLEVDTDSTFGAIWNTINVITNQIWELIELALGGIMIVWDEFGEDITSVVSEVFGFIFATIENSLSLISGIIETFTGLITGDWERMTNGLDDTWEALWSKLENILSTSIEIFDVLFGELALNVIDSLKHIKERGIELIGEMTEAITGWFGNMRDRITGAVKDMADGVTGFFGDMANKIVGNSIVPDMVDGIIGEYERLNIENGNILEDTTGSVYKELEEQISLYEKLLAEREELEQGWSQKLKEQSETRVERLEREKEEAIKEAEELYADTSDIVSYYDNEIQKIKDQEAQREREREERKLQERERFEQQWSDRVARETMSRLDILEMEKERALQEAEEMEADKTAILEYFERKRTEIEKDEEAKRRDRIESNLSFFEDSLQTTFSSILSQTESVTDAFESMWDNVVDSVVDRLAEIAASRVFDFLLSGATGGLGGGGLLSGVGSMLGGIFHQGMGAGVVPGPRGADIPVMATGGEMFAYPEQIASMAASIANRTGGGGKGNATIVVQLDGRTIAKAVEQPLHDRILVKGGA